MTRVGWVCVAGLVTVTTVACGNPAPLAPTPTVEPSDPQQSTCKVAKDPLNPLIVEWPGTQKVILDRASQRGAVVVSYVGCVLKVLSACRAVGEYELKAVTPVRDKMTIESESELYARLPLGVAQLKGDLASSSRLELEYVAVGQRELSRLPGALSGDCGGATHYVQSIIVGAYGLDAVGMAKGSGSGGVGVQEVGGGHSEMVRRLRGSGDLSTCLEVGAKGSACGAVLQLGLAPLDRTSSTGASSFAPAAASVADRPSADAGTSATDAGSSTPASVVGLPQAAKDDENDVDRDGVPNARDACPQAPGSADPNPRRNGCPAFTSVQGGQIRLRAPILFEVDAAQLLPETTPVLQEIANVMKGDLEIKRVAVEAHTDNSAPLERGKKLSQDRAEAVVRWLIDHGVSRDRLEAHGFGEERPLVPNVSISNKMVNRRVELKIVEVAKR